jgi:hypothetical protein
MRLTIYLLASLAIAICAADANESAMVHGTFIAGFLQRDFLVTGADSRVVLSDVNDPNKVTTGDNACKIHFLNDNAIFALAGTGPITINGQNIFDPNYMAARAYSDARGNISTAADDWGRKAQAIVRQNSGLAWKEISGEFFGFDFDGRSHMRNIRVGVHGEFFPAQDFFGPDGQVVSLGETDLVQEFLKSDRAKTVTADPTISDVVKNGKLLRLLIEDVIERKSAGGDLTVGGKVAVAVLERGQRARWQYSTPECDAENHP